MSEDMTTMVGSTPLTLGTPEVAIRRKEQMASLVEQKVAAAKKNALRLKYGDNEVLLKDLAGPVVNLINDAEKFVDGAVSANPYASIAWAGVSLLLPLLLNPSKQAASLATGLSYVGNLIVRSDMRQRLYDRQYKTSSGSEELQDYRDTLKELYTRILKFEVKCVVFYSKNQASRLGRDIVKWDAWDSMLQDITGQEGEFLKVYDIWKDLLAKDEYEKLSSRHTESIDAMKMISENILGFQRAVASAQDDTHRAGLIQWLSTADPSINYNNAREKHQPETGNWLTQESADFKVWESAPNSFLWLNGKAGSGKTILSSSVIKHLKHFYGDNPQVALAYYYFRFDGQEKLSILTLARSLIKQLYCYRPNTPEAVEALHKYRENGQNPELDELQNALIATIRGFSDAYIVLDALDEFALNASERKELVDFIRQVHKSDLKNLHILCTSRREMDIEKAFKPLFLTSAVGNTDVDLTRYREKVDHDIGLHIDKTLASETYDDWSEELKREARQALVERADGMFQYISCQFDTLRDLPGPRAIRKALKDLPVGLDATYDRIFQSIKPEYQKPVANILKWLAFSFEPLSVEQLAEIFILDHDRKPPFDEEDRPNRPESVLNYFPSIVTIFISGSDLPTSDLDIRSVTKLVRLAHFSIKEYLISPRIAVGPAKVFYTTALDAHLHISEACMAYHLYLSATRLATEERCKHFALWKYAGNYWTDHLEEIPRASWPSLAIEVALQILTPKSQDLLNMIRIADTEPHFYYSWWDQEISVLSAPLYYVAARGDTQLTGLLLDEKVNIDELSPASTYGFSLAVAASNGNIDIVKLLLDRGADINLQEGAFGSALQAAAYNGRESITQLLLDRGANVNLLGGENGSALIAASYGKRKEIVRLLLHRDADINLQGGDFGSALQAAAFVGDENITQLLLNGGADANAQGGIHGSALVSAAHGGHEGILRILLNGGVDINAKTGMSYGNALYAAIARDEIDCANLLISRGAKVWPSGPELENELQRIDDTLMKETADKLRRFQEDPNGYITAAKARAQARNDN